MKKMFGFIMLALFAAVTLSAEDTLIKTWPLAQKNDAVAWCSAKIKAESSVKDGVASVKVTTVNDGAAQFDGQWWIPSRQQIKPGQYRLDFTLKSNQDITVSSSIMLSKAPYTSLSQKAIVLKADQPVNVSLSFKTDKDLKDTYRMPCIAFGRMKVGGVLELSNVKLVEVK